MTVNILTKPDPNKPADRVELRSNSETYAVSFTKSDPSSSQVRVDWMPGGNGSFREGSSSWTNCMFATTKKDLGEFIEGLRRLYKELP